MKDYFKKLKDEHKFYSPISTLISSKTFTSDQKLVLTVMMANLEMNDEVTWCQNTYADKTNKSRNFIVRLFKKFVEVGLLIPDENNKVGYKYNKYKLNTRRFERLLSDNNPASLQIKHVVSKPKHVVSKPKPVVSKPKPVVSKPKPVAADYIYRSIDSTESTYLYRKEADDGLSPSPSSLSDEEKVFALGNVDI